MIVFQRHIPNILTLFRLMCVPLILWYILQERFYLAFILFAVASVTDFLDGYLARRWNVVSTLGGIIDPLADKSLMVGSYLVLGYLNRIPLWLVMLVIGRDILIILAGIVTYLFKLPIAFKPTLTSKINTFCQIILAGMVLLTNYNYSIFSGIGILDKLMLVLLCITSGLTIWSGLEYVFYFIKEFRKPTSGSPDSQR